MNVLIIISSTFQKKKIVRMTQSTVHSILRTEQKQKKKEKNHNHTNHKKKKKITRRKKYEMIQLVGLKEGPV